MRNDQHLPLSVVEVKNERRSISAPPIFLHGSKRDIILGKIFVVSTKVFMSISFNQ